MVWVVSAAARVDGARGGLESALPGEWAAFFVTLAVIALVGAAILVVACLGHERTVVRRRLRRARRRGDAVGRDRNSLSP